MVFFCNESGPCNEVCHKKRHDYMCFCLWPLSPLSLSRVTRLLLLGPGTRSVETFLERGEVLAGRLTFGN